MGPFDVYGANQWCHWRVLKTIQTTWKTFPCFYAIRMKQCRCAADVITNSVCDLGSSVAPLRDRLYKRWLKFQISPSCNFTHFVQICIFSPTFCQLHIQIVLVAWFPLHFIHTFFNEWFYFEQCTTL